MPEQIVEFFGWPACLAVAALLFFNGIRVLYWGILCVLPPRHRVGQTAKIAALIGAMGLIAPTVVGVLSLLNADTEVDRALLPFWPTSYLTLIPEYTSPRAFIAAAFAAAVLSNVGLYGVIGLGFSAAWTKIRHRQLHTSGKI